MPRAATEPPHFAYDWATTRVYELDVLWWGVSIGGRHYTGHVCWHVPGTRDYPRHEIERKLSLKEAKLLDPDAGERYWKSGIRRVTNRFDTRASLERAAVKWVEEHATGVPNWILLPENGTLNPCVPIEARGWFADRLLAMTELFKAWDPVSNRIMNSDIPAAKKAQRAVYNAWYGLLTPPKS